MRRPDTILAKATAKRVLTELRIEAPDEIQVEDIAFHLGFKVRECELSACRAYVVGSSHGGVIRVRAGLALGERRFAIAHELGHVLQARSRREPLLLRCTDAAFLDWYRMSEPEAFANSFAAELLMPAAMVGSRCDAEPSLEAVGAIADEFGTSLTAAAIRFVEHSDDRCAVVMSLDGHVAWCWPSTEFRHWVRPRKAVDSSTLAYDYFLKGSCTDTPELVPADAWFDDDEPMEGEIMEHSRPLPRFGAVLSLLWLTLDDEE